MNKLVLKYNNYWEDVLYRFKIYLTSDFSKLTNVSQVYGLVLNSDDEILLVSADRENWGLPGGGVEKGESLIDALVREVYEEAAVIIDDKTIRPFFFQKVFTNDNGWKYSGTQARFVCRVASQDKFSKDPDMEDIKYQMFVDLKKLDQYLKWGRTTEFIQKEVLKVAA